MNESSLAPSLSEWNFQSAETDRLESYTWSKENQKLTILCNSEGEWTFSYNGEETVSVFTCRRTRSDTTVAEIQRAAQQYIDSVYRSEDIHMALWLNTDTKDTTVDC
jgi:hypothetical protein